MMTAKRRLHSTTNAFAGLLALMTLGFAFFPSALGAESVVLHLKNGDRLAGELISENENDLVLKTTWADSIVIPRDYLERKEVLPAATVTDAVTTQDKKTTNDTKTTDEQNDAVVAKKAEPAEKPREWKLDAKLGADMLRGEKERDVYYGQLTLTYTHPYESDPSRYFRNLMDYRADYSITDGNKSANRMYASDKMDFDISERAYLYNVVGAGYDEVRLINAQYEIGPGAGYHLFRRKDFAANIEAGVSYQFQDRDTVGELESLYSRLGQDFTWKVYSKIVLTQRATWLTSFENSDEMQFRLEANLAFGIVHNLSLNLTALELYDTRPVPGVTRNEFQLRSSLGLTF